MRRITTIGLAIIACIAGFMAFFFFAPIIHMVINPCLRGGDDYVSSSYYLFNHGEAHNLDLEQFLWLTHGPVVFCI
jgi:hypothetical protein